MTPELTTEALEIIVICGSTRFVREMADIERKLTWEGRAVFAPTRCNLKTPHPLWADRDDKAAGIARLDSLHRSLIRLAAEVLIVNPGGYVGDSTRAEITYALKLGKPVRYTETYEHAVLITRPGHDGLRLGPLRYRRQAEDIAASLTGQLPHTAHIPGTTIKAVTYDPTQPHRALPTNTDPYDLATAMNDASEHDPARPGVNFPDLYSLLLAQHGHERAGVLWTAACNAYDLDDEDH